MNQTMKNRGITMAAIPGAVKHVLLTCCIFIAFLSSMPAQADFIVENFHASQRPGTAFRGGSGFVDIYYDVSGTTCPLTVSILISNDDGASWTVNPTTASLSGDIGSGILSGTGNHIVWAAGFDYLNVYWEKTKARIIVTEQFDSIVVSPTPTNATWNLAGPEGFEGNGQTFQGVQVFLNTPKGYYTLTCDALAGFMTPATETQTLFPGTRLAFNPHWFIMLPGDVPMVLMRIPKGSFMMGSPAGEQDSDDSERPQHEVTLSNDFYMGKYEVTQAQWTAIMGTTPWSGKQYALSDGNGPAIFVTWYDINGPDGFLDKLNKHLGTTEQPYRLPTEAEWEYVCRANETTRFYWGDDLSYTDINDYAWWRGNAWDANEMYAHIVGQKLPNAFGLYDMSGNVWEWCQDQWHSNYTGAPNDGTAWEDDTSTSRVLRGGDWNYGGRFSRSANRNDLDPDDRNVGFGFRIVRTQP